MSYQMTPLLQKCQRDDVKFIIETINSYINFSDDKGLKYVFSKWEEEKMPIEFANKLETEIRYLGSSEIAYAYRKMAGRVPAGVDVDEILRDIAKMQKITLKAVSSFEGKLEELVKRMVERGFMSFSPEQQRELLEKFVKDRNKIDDFFKALKAHKNMLLPLLSKIIGEEVVLELIKNLTILIIAKFVGREAAKKLLEMIAKRIPAQWLGPAMWVATTAWLAIDITGPAYRKLIPIMLTLGVVALRDGPEDENFWKE